MKKLIAKIVHFFNPNFFKNKSYWYLSTWNIVDVYNNKLIFHSEGEFTNVHIENQQVNNKTINKNDREIIKVNTFRR